MTRRLRTLASDGDWTDFRTDRYFALLHATAYIWVANLVAAEAANVAILDGRVHNFDRRAIQAAYKRATLAIPQLPMEVGNVDLRFERCRWRHEDVPTGTPTTTHCEHPWSKKRTRKLVEASVRAAMQRGVDTVTIAEAIAVVLDVRQDTVLMPSDDDKKWGIRNEKEADGLAGRYRDITERLVDRKTGDRLTPQLVAELEAERTQSMRLALDSIQ